MIGYYFLHNLFGTVKELPKGLFQFQSISELEISRLPLHQTSEHKKQEQ